MFNHYIKQQTLLLAVVFRGIIYPAIILKDYLIAEIINKQGFYKKA